MRRHLLLGSALLAIFSDASAHGYFKRNATVLVVSPTSSSLSTSISSTASSGTYGSSSSSTFASSSSSTSASSSSSTFTSSSLNSDSVSSSLSKSYSSTTAQSTGSSSNSLSFSSTSTSLSTLLASNSSTTSSPTTSTATYSTSFSSSIASNSSSLVTTNSSIITTTRCTGCILQALFPMTLTFNSEATIWTSDPSTTITQTLVIYNYTFSDGHWSTTAELENVTQTIPIPANQTEVFTTPVFKWSPPDQPDITLTLETGATYVAFTDIWGALETQPTPTAAPVTTGTLPVNPPFTPSCEASVSFITIKPTNAAQYSSFIQTFETSAPDLPFTASLPPALIQFLEQDPSIMKLFHSSDLGTCTVSTPRPVTQSGPPPATTQIPFESTSAFSPFPTSLGEFTVPPPTVGAPSPTTSNFLTVTTTTKYSTRDGNLRTDTGVAPIPPVNSVPTVPSQEPPVVHPESQGKPNQNTLDIPEIIASIINDPGFSKPGFNPASNPPGNVGSITFGNTVLPVHPAEPTNQGQNGQSGQNPGIVIGSQTLAPGQATTINGVLVSVPQNGGGSSLVVGGSTVGVNSIVPTGPAVLTVGENTVTANSQGQFVFGTQTLTPGGPAITFGGTTLSLGPSGTIGIVNGVTQTLGNAPLITAAPVLTIGHETIPATVIGGSTMFVLGPGQTLTPGGSIVFEGSTLSMPADGSGSTIVINGATQTLNNPSALPVLTLGAQSLTASVVDGTTEFVLGQGQTLTPGGSLVISGTTFSMPLDGSGSTVIVNGVTQTLSNPSGLPVLTLGGQSLTASVIGGTTEFIIGPGQTLTPGGVITVSGTTFSMPASASGSVVVVNGVTSTLGQGPITAYPALTIDGKTYSATIRDGTTEFVIGPGTTLKPGEQVTISGTTYSLDSQGTALIINGKTSSIPRTPASNSATTTGSGSRSQSTSGSTKSSGSSFSSSTTSKQRDPGNFIASGIGITSKKGDAVAITGGLDKWAEGMLLGLAGWLLMFL